MSEIELISTIAAALVIGALIGAAGVGGVLLTPWLTQVNSLTVQHAMGVAMLGFIGPGVVALLSNGGSRTALSPTSGRMLLWTVPGALAGTMCLVYLPERAALVVLAASIAFIGIRLVVAPEPFARRGPVVHTRAGSATTGLCVGFGSAITVTSGPMILTPWLLWRGSALAEAISLGQLVQLPIAASATAVNLAAGSADVVAGLAMMALLVPGVLLGSRLAGVLPRPLLGRLVGVLLLVASGTSIWKALR